MERNDELLIAIIGINYIIKDLKEQLNGIEMCRIGDIENTINMLEKLKDQYNFELFTQTVDRFGL